MIHRTEAAKRDILSRRSIRLISKRGGKEAEHGAATTPTSIWKQMLVLPRPGRDIPSPEPTTGIEVCRDTRRCLELHIDEIEEDVQTQTGIQRTKEQLLYKQEDQSKGTGMELVLKILLCN